MLYFIIAIALFFVGYIVAKKSIQLEQKTIDDKYFLDKYKIENEITQLKKQQEIESRHLQDLHNQAEEAGRAHYEKTMELVNNNIARDIDALEAEYQQHKDNYKQEFFNSTALQDPTPAQRLELILIKLAQNMFTQIGHTTGGSDINHKPRYDRLFNVSIQYETDTSFDSTINPSTTDGIRYYNKAIFVLNSVEFTVYAQKGKNFGSEVSRSVDENEKPL